MKDSDPPDSDDDGWGEAADAAAAPASEAAVENEWDDPADLEKRVAALRVQRDSAPVPVSDGALRSTSAQTEPDEPTAPPEIAPVAPPEIEPAAPPEIAPVAPPEIAPAAPPEIEPPNANDPSQSLTARQKKFIVGGSVALMLAALCALVGWFNNQNYYLSCGTKSITAMQGLFWPWGAAPLAGSAFKAIQVPSDVICTNQHFESRRLLEDAFLDALLKQSTALLTSGDAEHVDTAEKQLEQALLLTRAPERSAQRTLAQRLQGDVSYWRGAAQISAAAELLHKGANHFEEAAAKRPRHTSDANAWADHARFIESEIGKGPRALRKDEAPKETPTFQGLSPDTAPPINDLTPSPPPLSSAPADAGIPQDLVDAAWPPADAALPKGGVLL